MDKQAKIQKLRKKIELANALLNLVEMERVFVQKIIRSNEEKIERLEK